MSRIGPRRNTKLLMEAFQYLNRFGARVASDNPYCEELDFLRARLRRLSTEARSPKAKARIRARVNRRVNLLLKELGLKLSPLGLEIFRKSFFTTKHEWSQPQTSTGVRGNLASAPYEDGKYR